MDTRLILITLLIKLGVAAAIATALMRSRFFTREVFREERSVPQQLRLVVMIGTLFTAGAWIRLNVGTFRAGDLAFEAAMLIGVMGGPLAGAVAGLMLGVPAMTAGEYVGMPFYIVAGTVAGFLRRFADAETVWSFSPFIDLSIYRWIRRNIRRPRLDWQTAFFLVILLFELIHIQLGRAFPGKLFYLDSPNPWVLFAIYASTVAAVSIPVKIWNTRRIELKLEEQERLLLVARLDALQSQINPHFLFNTLNSISSLVRFDPDTARELVVKLASILRRLLSKHDAFVPLSEEVEFIDDYLDIEVVRFGRDKLRVEKQLDPETLDLLVPSMILQPLIENSVKHGLAPKVDGGTITLRSHRDGDTLSLQLEDDGVGMEASAEAQAGGRQGIGLSNVAERMHVLYGDAAKLSIRSRPDGNPGTLITLEFPVLETDPATEPIAATRIYAERAARTRS